MSKNERLESTIQRTLSEIYRVDVKNERIGFITITECRLTNDFSHLTIYYTILGAEAKREAARRALESSKGFVRSKLAQRVQMRKSPALIFKYDPSLDYGNKISKGLKEVLNEDQ